MPEANLLAFLRVQLNMEPDKRFYRKLKRDLKRAGNKSRRQHLKRELTQNPEDAPYSEYDFGRNSSAGLNGMDRDTTRKRYQEPEEE
jgi:hypothetical protein